MNTYAPKLILTGLAALLVGCAEAPAQTPQSLSRAAAALDGETLIEVPRYAQGAHRNLSWAAATAMLVSFCNRDQVDRTLEIARDYARSEASFDVVPPGSSVPELIHYLHKHSRCTAREQPSLLMWEDLKAEIKQGHPIYARVDYWDPDMQLLGEGYVAVIRGYDERQFTRILVYYPETGEERWELWNYFATNRQQIWTATGLLVDEPTADEPTADEP